MYSQANVSTAERWPRDYRIPDVAVALRDDVLPEETPYVRPAVAFETTGTGSGDEDRSVRELFWGEE